MGKLIPFKQKNLTTEEQALRKRLQTNPDDFEALGNLLILKIRDGKFNHESDYAHRLMKSLEKATPAEVDQFIVNISPISEAIDWSEPSQDKKPKPQITFLLTDLFKAIPNVLTARKDVYTIFFKDESFLDDICKLVAESKVNKNDSPIGKGNLALKPFFIDCIEKIIIAHGIRGELAGVLAFCNISHNVKNRLVKGLKNISSKTDNIFEEIAAKHLTAKFQNDGLKFIDLYKLLELNDRLHKDQSSEVCNAMIDAVSDTDIQDIAKVIQSAYFSECFSCKETGISYIRKYSTSPSDFIEDLYVEIHKVNKFNQEIAFEASLFFMHNLESCPLGYLVLASIYNMDQLDLLFAANGFSHAGAKYFDTSYYHESMTCLKTSLFNAAFMVNDNPLEVIDMNQFVQTTRKLNAYEDSINFLSKFKLLHEHGLPIHQGFLNEIEATKTELEYELSSRTFHKIDEFYELVAQENFPAIQSHVLKKGTGKFTLTGEQLQILLKKIQEKSDIIQGIKSISAKCDMLMYMHREVYDKQAAILDTLKDNQGAVEDLLNRNSDRIIENIHQKNEKLSAQINIKICQEFYHGHFGVKLWDKLDEGTRKYLLLAQHLDNTSRFSPSDECGFIAIEFALAIENEFKRKIIDGYLSREPHIKYKTADKIRQVTHDSKITLGEICVLVDKTRKVKGNTDLLWPFNNFIVTHSHGSHKIFNLKNALFDIKDKYRNPAAHPSNYTRDLLDAFKNMLFEQAFLKDYLEAVQIKRG